MIKKLAQYSLLALLLATGACASIVTDSTQVIAVNSEPSGASCQINGRDGFATKITTPGTFTINKGRGDLAVICEKDMLKGSGAIEESLAGMVFGNILFGGLIGVGIDAATGKMWKYSESVSIPLMTDTATQPTVPSSTPEAPKPATSSTGEGKPIS